MGAHDMHVSVGYGLLSYIRVDAPSHLRAPVMHAVAILHDVVGGAKRVGVECRRRRPPSTRCRCRAGPSGLLVRAASSAGGCDPTIGVRSRLAILIRHVEVMLPG